MNSYKTQRALIKAMALSVVLVAVLELAGEVGSVWSYAVDRQRAEKDPEAQGVVASPVQTGQDPAGRAGPGRIWAGTRAFLSRAMRSKL